MNIKDTLNKVQLMKELLSLDGMMSKQLDLFQKYHKIELDNHTVVKYSIPLDLDEPQHQARIKDQLWRITEELGEAAGCLKNKPWKQTHMETDKLHFYEELSDALHFFLELFIMLGLTAEDVAKLYFAKAKVNEFRQESNY